MPEVVAVAGIRVRADIVSHPLLGDAHVIEGAAGELTAMSAVDWANPRRIPTIADPGRLPPGAGAALLNELARRADRAGVRALRYAGPYPTPGLWRALGRSFRTAGREAEFTADVLGRALRLATDEIPIDFQPAPHDRVDLFVARGDDAARDCTDPGSPSSPGWRGWAEVRDQLERVVIDGVSYDRDGSPARLVGDAAELWFGDAPYAAIAQLDARGVLVDGPHAPPALASAVIGQAFPPALRAALAELVADVVPTPLADDARALVAERPIAWADLGARAARRTADGFEVHAVLWERIAPLGLTRLALALAEALGPAVTSAILALVTSRISPGRAPA